MQFNEVERYFTLVLFYLSCIVSLVGGAVVTWSDVTRDVAVAPPLTAEGC